MSVDETDSMDHVNRDYRRLVEDDLALLHPAADVGDLVARGRRTRRHRGLVATGAGIAAVAAVTVPLAALGTWGGDGVARPEPDPVPFVGTDKGPDNSPPPTRSTLRGCGWFSCTAPGSTPDTHPVLGDVAPVSTTPSGIREVVWASRRTLHDPATDTDVQGTVLMTGFADDDQRVDGVFALQPGHEFQPACTIPTYDALLPRGGWAVLGYVEGAADRVSYDGASTGTAQVASATVLDGYTVFVAQGPGGPADVPLSFTAYQGDEVVATSNSSADLACGSVG